MIKAFLLDIDGTLVDSNEAHVQAWVEALKKFGYDIRQEVIRPLIGMGGDQLLPSLGAGLTKEDGDGKKIVEYRTELFLAKYVGKLHPTKGSRELILELKRKNIRCIVATSASDKELRILLKKAQVDDLLNEYTSASDVESSKPAPDIVRAALDKLHMNPSDVVMLGDTPYDIAAAGRCNVSVIALRSGGFSDQQLKEAHAIFDDPHDVLKHLPSLLQ